MQDVNTLHLVSDTTQFPTNTPQDFKVLFDIPFDISNRKIALIDATITKKQANVLGEKLSFHFLPKVTVKKYAVPSYTRGDCTDVWSETDFKNKFNYTSIKKAATVSSSYRNVGSVRYLVLRVTNSTNYPLHVDFISTKHTNSQDKYDLWHFKKPENDVLATLETTPTAEHFKHHLTMEGSTSKELFFYMDKNRLPPANHNEFCNQSTLSLRGRYVVVTTREKVISFSPGPGFYSSIEELLAYFNNQPKFSRRASFAYIGGKVHFRLKPSTGNCAILFGELKHILGFEADRILHKKGSPTKEYHAENPPNMSTRSDHFYIYCSLVNGVMVNNKKLQLLGVLDATESKFGEQKTYVIQNPQYLKVVPGRHQLVEITISNPFGDKVGLLMKRTKLTLRFQ